MMLEVIKPFSPTQILQKCIIILIFFYIFVCVVKNGMER